ncbi:Ig-like domain-containing protein [Microvirga calopogonii]|uniref:Ig-like domain-containing protein n=1 Tax=Microvirga calopogonii TaxID=2078013 RepID=UPI000E0D1883|nr:Ig-like domain-containing protein [Microvirga calopogonii]
MTQQPDLTIPFDASVVDEEALRALRAVQRTVPMGDGGAAGNLAGGTEAVAAFGMMPGSPSGGAGGAAGIIPPVAEVSAPRPAGAPLERLDEPAPAVTTVSLAAAPIDVPIFVDAPPSRPVAPPRIGGSHEAPGSTVSSHDIAAPSEVARAQTTPRDEDRPIPTPEHSQPQPEEPRDNVASAPVVRAADSEGQEDQAIALDLSAVLTDNDGSELLSIKIYGVREGASLSHGKRQPDGSWSVAPTDLPHLAFIPPDNFSGTVNLRLQATSQELNGSTAIIDAPFQIQVHAVADAPDVVVADARGYEDTPVSLLGLGGALRDTDGSESLSFVLSGVPVDATLSAGTPLGGGRWALTPAQLEGLILTPPPQMSGHFTLTLTAIATESEPGVPSARTSATFTVSVDPVVDAGSIGGSSAGSEDGPILLQPNFSTPDHDGSETWSEFTQVAGLPPGASLNLGSEIAPGVWQVSTADLRAGLVTIRPAEHSDEDFTLTLTATLTDSGNGKSVSRAVTGTHTVAVTAVADEPLVAARDVSGHEDQSIPLNVSAVLADTDGSETLTVRILGVPDGASLSHGTRQPDGSWNVPPADLAHLSITPPHDFAGTIKLTLEATVRESSNGSTATHSVGFRVDVEDVSDAPLVSVHDAAGREDEWTSLDLRAALTDTDGSETLTVSIIGVPAGARLSQGIRAADGSWQVTPEQLAGLAILPPENFSGTINLSLRSTSISPNGSTAIVDSPFRIHVDAVADTPVVGVHDAATKEDQPIALDLSAALTDTDGSEMLSVVIEGLPAGSRLSAGIDNGDGSWTLAPGQLSGLTLTPPVDWSGRMDLTLVAQARETSNGSTATVRAPFTVAVEAVADAPLVSAHDVSGLEDTPIALDLSAMLKDRDGSEVLSVVIWNVPTDASLSHGSRQPDGSWVVAPTDLARLKFIPKPDFSGPVNLRIEATAREGNDDTATSTADFRVQIHAVADTPDVTVANFTGREDEPVALTGLGGALRDIDGSETLSFILTVPPGATLNAGTRQADGSWLLTPAQLNGLVLTPPANSSGRFELTLTSVATEREPGVPSARNTAKFTVDLDPVLDQGTITGSASGNEDTWITLTPKFDTPDQDGSETWSALTTISGVPTGASLNRGTMVEPGVWKVSTSALQDGLVRIKPPLNSDEDFTLTFTATLTDTGNGKSVSQVITGTNPVIVNAVADKPTVSASNASGKEDQEIPLNLSAGLVDTDGSETLTVRIYGVPASASLTKGVLQSDGSWIVSAADLPNVALKPPVDFSGTLDLRIRATATESSNGKTAWSEATFQVQVDAVADEPGLRVAPAVGDEDTAIPLTISAWTTDRDGSETITGFRITGIPEGAVIRAGGVALVVVNGSVLVDPAVVNSLTITPPAQSDEDFTLKVSAVSAEPNGSTAESAPLDLRVTVRAVADAPVMDVTGASGLEDTPIALNLSATLPDNDGSETLSFVIRGVPDGAVMSHGTYRGPGVWSLTAEEARLATLLPPANFSGTINLTVTAITQEERGGDQASTTIPFPVKVEAVIDIPAVGGLDGVSGNWGTMHGTEDQPILLRLDPGLADSDGSEKVVGDILISDVPAGAVLRLADSTVVNADENGIYRISAANMTGVTLIMPRDSDEAHTLRIEMTIEDSGGVRATIGGKMVVDPLGDADTPNVTFEPSQGSAHNSLDPDQGWIPLHITAIPADKDGSETLQMWVRDVPAGAVLSSGIAVGEGIWLVPVQDLPTLSIRPKAGSTERFELKVTAVAVEREGDQTDLTVVVPVTLTVPSGGGGDGDGGGGTNPGPDPDKAPLAQAPSLVVKDADTLEDRSVLLSIEAETKDTDGGHETLGIRINGVPEGASLSVGVRDPLTGAWALHPDQLKDVRLIPPANFSGRIDLQVVAVSTEATGDQKAVSATISVNVEAVADNAVINANPSVGEEDGAVPLKLLVTPGDSDGSEFVAPVIISGVPAGGHLEGAGVVDLGNGRWSVDSTQLENLKFVPPANSHGTYHLTVTATTQETSNDDTHETQRVIAVTVVPKADAPTVTVHDAAGKEDGTITLDLSASLVDTDGSEVLSVVIQGLPEGARLSKGINNGDGSWTLTPSQLAGLTVTPPADWSGTMNLTVQAHARELSNGSVATTEATIQVNVEAVADTPVVGARDAAGLEDQPIALSLSAALTDRDGSEVLSVVILGMPAGASLTYGTRQSDGTWIVAPADLPRLAVIPPENFSGTFGLTMRAITREPNGDTATSAASFRVQVEAVADAPNVTVRDFTGNEDTSIRLTGLGGALVDTDGSESLSYILSGLPAGASLNAGTKQPDGSWLLTPSQLNSVVFTPPPNVSGQFTLTLTGIATESAGGSVARTSKDFTIGINPVADAGTIAGTSVGHEDTPILLNPTFALSDNDGSETWSEFTQVSGLPAGASLDRGTQLAPGTWLVATADLRAGLVSINPVEHSDADFTLTLKATITDTGNGISVSREVTGVHVVTVNAVADAPNVAAQDATGQEDHAIALNLSAALVDTDGSETLTVNILGVPDGFALSHGTSLGSGVWQVPSAALPGLQLHPAQDWNGTLHLTLQATSNETSGGSATATTPFTVTIEAVNDAPELVLNAPAHAEAGAHQASAVGLVEAHDVDSLHLGGATVTLTGAQAGDRLDFDGYVLHEENGHMMVGDTGIEVVGGGYASHSGTLTLRGDASPDIYSAVLQSLVLESAEPTGLAAGSRNVAVTLFDSEGTASAPKAIEVIVDEPPPPLSDAHGPMAAADTTTSQDLSGSDILLMMADGMMDPGHGAGGAWTEQIDIGTPAETAPHQPMELDQPAPDHVQPIDNLQIEAARTHWS